MNLTPEQLELLQAYDVTITESREELLRNLDDKITEIGYNRDYTMNKVGRALLRLYNALYLQN